MAHPRTVATAAVRDASNGQVFLDHIERLGLEVELLSGEDEARMAGLGVLAGIPEADGIVGDLGGGSLELVRVKAGRIHETSSFPFGVLRLGSMQEKGPRALGRIVAKALTKAGWVGRGQGLPFYMVGGSWRSLARVHMHMNAYPLPILHHYRMGQSEAQHMVRVLAQLDKKRLRDVVGLSGSRIPTLKHGATLLSHVTRHLGSSEMIISAYGLREGLLYSRLPERLRAEDPLIAATREEGRRQGRFPEHGDLLDRWIDPLFGNESVADARLRHATCLLADVGWRAHPEFRAERGQDTALHGNWVGVDARGRAMMAHALYVSFAGPGVSPIVAQLCSPEDRAKAERWGLAIRMGQRMSGGAAEALQASAISIEQNAVMLRLDSENRALYGEAVERRHKMLATAFGLSVKVSTKG